MLGQLGQLHDARGIEEANRIEPRDWRHGGPAACIDYDALALELARATAFQFHDDALRALESGLAEDQFDIGGFLQRLLTLSTASPPPPALSLFNPPPAHPQPPSSSPLNFLRTCALNAARPWPP